MRRIALAAAVAGAVVFAAGSTAATHQVVINAAGFVPATVTVAVGDTVTWTNADTRNRQLTSQSASFTSPVLRPGDTYSFTFTKAGTFRYEDSLVRPRQRGTVVVRGATSVTIAAQPKTVVYGRATNLSGAITAQRANETVSILAKRCRTNAFTKIGETKTAADGTWSFQTKPLDHTTYRAQWGSGTNDAAVRARPRITLAKLAPHRYRARVYAAESFAGKALTMQRWNATRRVWVFVRSVTLVDTGLGIDPTVISGRNFRSAIRAGKRIRLVMGQTVAGSCYLAHRSNVIFS